MAKRRNVMLGIGALAFGSGAVTMTGAFDSEFTTDAADFRVIAEANLQVRAGEGVPTDGDPSPDSPDIVDLSDESDPRVNSSGPPYLDYASLSATQIPVAGVLEGDENENLVIEVAVPITPSRGSTFSFDDLLEIENLGDTTESGIGIEYRRGSPFGGGAYGDDVVDSPSNNEIGPGTVQEVFSFELNSELTNHSSGLQISPDSKDGGSSIVHDTSNDSAMNEITIEPAETGQLSLVVNTHLNGSEPDNIVGRLQSQASVSGNPFDGDTGVLDLLDEIVIGEGGSTGSA